MAANNIVLYTAFDPTSVSFGPPDRNRNGGKFVPILNTDGSKRRITIQTPVLSMPFGVSAFREKPDAEVQSYSIDVSFRNLDTDPKLTDFLTKMRGLDVKMIESAVANSKSWFGKQKSKETLEDNYRKLVKDHPEGKYPPVMKVKVPIQNGQPSCVFFDESRQPCDIDYLVKGTTIKLILEMDRVWFVNQSFGVSWRAVQGAVVSRPNRMDTYSMLDDGDDAAVLGLTDASGADLGHLELPVELS